MPAPRTRTPRRTGTATGFVRDEDGSMVLFGLYLFMAILLIGGISVDVMRSEFSRLRLQNTVDTAILAAADLDQRLDPVAVVKDHFEKAGLGEYLGDIEVVSSINSRTVTASSSVDVNTMFINALGVPSLRAAASGTAREDISDIEISLVLDVSGSMGNGTRLSEMKSAATSFVNTVLSDDRPGGVAGEVSISIVPYSTQVNVGQAVANALPLAFRQDLSHCVDFEGDDFSTTALPATIRNQTGHFDPWSRTSPPRQPVCRNEASFRARAISEDRDALLAQISALSPDGNTSTDLGLKWGIAMLDPSFRPVTAALVNTGEVAATFADRPYDYGRTNSMKVLVVMTDGENTDQYRLRDGYNSGMSDVWGRKYSDGSWRFSVDRPEISDKDGDGTSAERWYLPRTNTWSNTRDGGNAASLQLSYPQLWAAASMGYNAYYMWYRQYNDSNLYWDWFRKGYTTVSPGTKDDRMAQICATAKDRGILVFSVAFEIDAADAVLMKQCASSDNHYFEVDGADIVYAFTAIASTINQLRLTQ